MRGVVAIQTQFMPTPTNVGGGLFHRLIAPLRLRILYQNPWRARLRVSLFKRLSNIGLFICVIFIQILIFYTYLIYKRVI